MFDVHPLFVHFPIALLTIYTLLELIYSKKLKQNNSFFIVKMSFLIIGILGAFAALQTGDEAKREYTDSITRHLISVHSDWAAGTSWIFGILALAYIILAINKFYEKVPKNMSFNISLKISKIIVETPLIYLISIIGLVAITITGALGGAIVYGPDVDPIVGIIYKIIIG